MQFVELVLQGVRNFSQLYRLPFDQGVTVFVGAAGSGKSTVVEVLLRLLDPEPLEEQANDLQCQGADASRAALLLADEKGVNYRLVRDFGRGSMVLSRRDISSGQFVNISTSPSEIRQYLGGEIHLPQRDLLHELYLIRADSLPSARPRETFTAPPAPAEPAPALAPPAGGDRKTGFRGYQGQDPEAELMPDDPDEIRRQIETLRRDLSLAREVDDLQFELDGMRRQMFEMEQKTHAVAEAERRAAELERQAASFGDLQKLPEDFERRVRDFTSLRQQLERDLGRLEEEREQWEKRSHQRAPAPLGKDRLFVAGMALGLVALGVGIAGFFLEEYLRWVALFDLVGFGVALVCALRHIDASEASSRAFSRLKLLEQRKKKIEQEFEIGTVVVRKTMSELGVESPEAVLEQFGRAAELRTQAKAARQEAHRLRSDPAVQEAAAKEKQMRGRVEELEAKLAGASGLMMGPQEMERRLHLLEQKLEGKSSTAPAEPAAGEDYGMDLGGGDEFGMGGPPAAMTPPTGGLPPSALVSAGVETAPASPSTGPLAQLLRCADDVFMVERERIEEMLSPRATQIVTVLSEGGLNRLSFGSGGRLQCGGAGGQDLPFESLPPASQDLVYLALKIAILEQASQRQRVPLLFDEPFDRLPGRLQPLLGRALAYLGRLAQVVFFSRDESWAQFGNSSLRLG